MALSFRLSVLFCSSNSSNREAPQSPCQAAQRYHDALWGDPHCLGNLLALVTVRIVVFLEDSLQLLQLFWKTKGSTGGGDVAGEGKEWFPRCLQQMGPLLLTQGPVMKSPPLSWACFPTDVIADTWGVFPLLTLRPWFQPYLLLGQAGLPFGGTEEVVVAQPWIQDKVPYKLGTPCLQQSHSSRMTPGLRFPLTFLGLT